MGYKIHAYNRPGKRHGGGVCIITDPNKIKAEENKFKRRGFEIISIKGKVLHLNRDYVFYCIYLPPNLGKKKAEEASCLVSEDIARIKLQLNNPIVIVGGDINQYGINDCVLDHDEFTIVPPLPTR